MDESTLICLAAGPSQVPLIKCAKGMGFKIIAIDKDPNAIGFSYSDYAINVSTHNFQEILPELDNLAKNLNINGIINRSSGLPVIVAASISSYLKLPGVPLESAKQIVNKDQLRQSCDYLSIPSPEYKVMTIGNHLSFDKLSFPLVVKPALSSIGKSGVSVVLNKKEMKTAIKDAEHCTENDMIIIEEYLPGNDLSFISFVNDGNIYPICFLDEINEVDDKGSVYGKGFKARKFFDDPKEKEALKIASKIVKKFKIKRSPLLISYREDANGKLNLVEIHLDLGGDMLIEEVFPNALPYNFLETSIMMAIGKVSFPSEAKKIKPTAIFYEKGEGLIRNKSFKVFTDDSQSELDKALKKEGLI